MSGPDAFPHEMSGLSSFPGRPGGTYDEPLLDMVFDRRPLPPGAPPEMHDLARLLAAAVGPAEPGELAGEAAALAAFSRAASPAGVWPAGRGGWPAGRRRGRRSSRWQAHGRAGLAAALVTALVVLGSTAAYTGVLPSRVQQMAHITFGAPAPVPDRHHGQRAKAAHRPLATPPPSGAARPPRHPHLEPARSAPTLPAAGQVKAPSPRLHRSPRHNARSVARSCASSPQAYQISPSWGPVNAKPHATWCPSDATGTRSPAGLARR
jgi:hypothetical protein